jgi:hypothetical protein
MIKPLTLWQKVIAYSSLAIILVLMVLGSYVIWLLLSHTD